MALIIADTDVLIDFMKVGGPAGDQVAQGLESGTLATTTITVFELLGGARTPRMERKILDLLDLLPHFPFDTPAARRAAQVRRELETTGQKIGMGDSLIAGIVLVRNGALLTRNVRHFGRVAGLPLVPIAGGDPESV